MSPPDPASLVDLERYPLGGLASPHARGVIEAARKSRSEKGVDRVLSRFPISGSRWGYP